MIQLGVVYRGRAIPLDCQVLEHGSAQVAFRVYRQLLERAATLLPTRSHVVLLADRGFADIALLRLCQRLGWGYRIRIKSNFLVSRPMRVEVMVEQLLPKGKSQAVFLHNVRLRAKRFGPGHLALAQPKGEEEP